MKRILILAIAWLALSAVAAAAQAPSQTATANLSITIPSMLKITNNTGDWIMPAITTTDVDNGATITSTNALDIETKGNTAFKVTVTAPNFAFTELYAGDAGYVKSANTASVTVGGTTVALNSGTSLFTHTKGTWNDNATASLTLTLSDPPGAYTTLVTFTIAAN